MFYPVFLNLTNQPVLVVGGGAVAERKVESLLEAGARVTVVSPQATGLLTEHASSKHLTLHRRRFAASDLEGIALVISATNDAATQKEVAVLAKAQNIPLNTVDKPELCSFIVPAVVRRGDVTVAISTSGTSPSLAAELRARIDRMLTDDIARVASVMGSVRQEVHERFIDSGERKRVFDSIIDSGIIEWIAAFDDASALQRVRRMIDEYR